MEKEENNEKSDQDTDGTNVPSSEVAENKDRDIVKAHTARAFLSLTLVIAVLSVVAYGLYYNKVDFGRVQVLEFNLSRCSISHRYIII